MHWTKELTLVDEIIHRNFYLPKSKCDYLFLSFHFSSALKSVLRKTRSNVVNAPNSSGGSNPKEANKVKPEAGYDFIEGSGKL